MVHTDFYLIPSSMPMCLSLCDHYDGWVLIGCLVLGQSTLCERPIRYCDRGVVKRQVQSIWYNRVCEETERLCVHPLHGARACLTSITAYAIHISICSCTPFYLSHHRWLFSQAMNDLNGQKLGDKAVEVTLAKPALNSNKKKDNMKR